MTVEEQRRRIGKFVSNQENFHRKKDQVLYPEMSLHATIMDLCDGDSRYLRNDVPAPSPFMQAHINLNIKPFKSLISK